MTMVLARIGSLRDGRGLPLSEVTEWDSILAGLR
jgi:hypothetical protein